MQKKLWTENIAILFLQMYYAWYFLPYLRVSINSQFFKNLFFCFYIIGTLILFINYLIISKGKIKLTFNILIPIVSYMIIMSIFVLFNFYDASKHIRVSFTFWGTALVYYLMSYNPKLRQYFGKYLMLLLIINSITSFIGVYTHEGAARALTNVLKTPEALEEDYILSKKNISSIYLFQSLAVMAPIFVHMIKKRIKTIWASIVLLFIVLAVLKASFTICLLLLITGILFSLIYDKGWIRKVLLLVFMLILFILPWGAIFSFFADVINNSYISERLYDISYFFSTGYIGKRVDGRVMAYLSSLKTFFMNPFGIGAHYSYIMFDNGIGYHSQIFDDLARYGIFALAFYIAFLSQYYKLLKKQFIKINMSEAVLPMFTVYLGCLMFNIAFRSSVESVVILFILPILPEIILNSKKNKGVHNIG